MVLGVVNYLLVKGQGIHDIATICYALVLIIAGLLLSRRTYFLILGLVIFSADLVILAEIKGWIAGDLSQLTDYTDILIVSAILGTIGMIMRLLSDNMVNSLTRTRQFTSPASPPDPGNAQPGGTTENLEPDQHCSGFGPGPGTGFDRAIPPAEECCPA